MGDQQAKQIAAQRLLQQIQESLSDTLTPSQARALMHLKGMGEADLSKRATLAEPLLKDWLSGSTPILPGRKLNLIELVLGVERGQLTGDRIHLFDLDESKLGKDKIAKMLDDISLLFEGGVRSQVCDDNGKDKWKDGARIHVVQMPKGQHAIIRHAPKSILGGNPVGARLESIRWASHGSNAEGERSELVVPKNLVQQLSGADLKENDGLSKSIVEHFKAAQQIKEHGSLKALASKLGRPR
jgi:hypothetical protein